MIQKRFENRATRRNNKKKKNKRFVNLMAISTVTAVIFAYSINGVADNKKVSNKVAVELGVEKIEKDKVKIKLDNFTPVIKSLQLSLKIDGNAKFKENSIEWLVKSKSNDIKTHTKISDDKKSMEIFIISNEPLDKNGGELEICEINVTKDGNGSSAYTINANVNNDGNSYSYIINDTNKQVSGNDIANLNMEKLTINSSPVISLKNLATVVDGNIFVSKGEDFDAKSYIVVNDEEDGEIPVDKVVVTGKVDTKKVGTYNINYSVSDSEGEVTNLKQTVIVEEVANQEISKPIITIMNNGQEVDKIVVTKGDELDLSKYISAVDYLGGTINPEIIGSYDVNKAGTYELIVRATDRFNNVSEKSLTLVVEKKVINAPSMNAAPVIIANDVELVVGDKFNELDNVKVIDEEDGEIPVDKVVVESDVDTTKVGNYKVIYSVTDSNGATTTKTINVKVSMKMVELEPSNPIKPEKPDEPTTPGNPELPDNPSIPENPDDSGNDNSGNINKPGNGSGSDDKVEAPDVPVTPETPKDDNSNTSTDNKVNSGNKNEIPKTGQGIFYGITITFAVLIIGFGVYFLKKKNK
ncbi:immunoglobulin-like domain-containing protein [uncultured Clostridium sp.]|jgi:LPXTG-motif cell wall-anchored protein|uniref:immunoglobulin-like domain-containing protein n=1 Tax=Clostridium sp. TaxID=1506 RepID=UPI0025F50121|nr:immunoglobulin-like domain-containing protein [uncultured Clostridium sp.]